MITNVVVLIIAAEMVVLFRSNWQKPVELVVESGERRIFNRRNLVEVLDYIEQLARYSVDDGDDSVAVERPSRFLLIVHSGEHHYRIELTVTSIVVSDGAGEELEL